MKVYTFLYNTTPSQPPLASLRVFFFYLKLSRAKIHGIQRIPNNCFVHRGASNSNSSSSSGYSEVVEKRPAWSGRMATCSPEYPVLGMQPGEEVCSVWYPLVRVCVCVFCLRDVDFFVGTASTYLYSYQLPYKERIDRPEPVASITT